jgi:hypothetical protein
MFSKRALKLCEKLGQIDTPRLTKVKGLGGGREGVFIVELSYKVVSYR